jgi:hypothetical protein
MSTSEITLHRLEAIEDMAGGARLEKVANKGWPELGVEYDVGIAQIDDKNARALGWRTGYPVDNPCDGGGNGRVYAPRGFEVGEIAFVQMNDPMLTLSTMDIGSIDSFLESLDKAEAMHATEIIGKYSLIGEIIACY